MSAFDDIPEIRGLDARQGLIRIPQELDVPLTGRVRQIIDTPEFRRLADIRQLGLVSLVYPAATHTRFEHSLGTYRLALLYLKHLSYDERFTAEVGRHEAEVLIAASLVHDIGHWPFCHPMEDIRLAGVPEHEMFANSFLLEGEIADILRDDWGIQPREIVALLSEKPRNKTARILNSILSGPIDIDKMDYLVRDSLHAGVPYGRHFDQQRLLGSLCLNRAGDGLAITDKGRTAAEMMVFARYVMFSEVYWHHAVRSATAMLQRAFSLLQPQLNLDALFRLIESPMIRAMQKTAGKTPAGELLAGLFGPRRRLYKRLTQYSIFQNGELYARIARKPYPRLTACSEALAQELDQRLARSIAPHHILFDAPPVRREVEFKIEVYFPKENCYRLLEEVSPVVATLAKKQFDDYVKRVRIYVHPDCLQDIAELKEELPHLVAKAIDQTA